MTAWSAIAFFAVDLERSNISQANTDNFLHGLGLDTNNYNLGQTGFRVSFFHAELPSQLVSKRIGPQVQASPPILMGTAVSECQRKYNR